MPKRSRDETVIDMPYGNAKLRRLGYAGKVAKHAPALAGLAGVGASFVYNRARGVWDEGTVTKPLYSVARRAIASPSVVRALEKTARFMFPSKAADVDRQLVEEKYARSNRTVASGRRIAEPGKFYGGDVYPMRLTSGFSASKVKLGPNEAEQADPVLAETFDGSRIRIPVHTYGHDADDVPDLRGSGVFLSDNVEVVGSTLGNLSVVGQRPIVNEDGDGAVLVRLSSGKVVWQVGVFRYPVQYMGKKIVPFSYLSGRYSSVVPSVNVV